MSDSESKYYNNFINGITYENYVWKDRYNNLWLNYINLQNEYFKLQYQLQECMNATSDTTVNTETTTEKNINNDMVLHLQNKNNELLKNLMNKSKENYFLLGELEKIKSSPNPSG